MLCLPRGDLLELLIIHLACPAHLVHLCILSFSVRSTKSKIQFIFPLFVFLSGMSVPFLLPDLVVGVIFQSFPLFLVHLICFNCNLRLSTYLISWFLAVPFLVHLSPVPICQLGWLCGCLSVCPFVLVSLRLCACLSAFVFHFLVFCFFNRLLIGPFVMSMSLSHICCLFCLFIYLSRKPAARLGEVTFANKVS